MAVTFGFYDSIEGDRMYNAIQFSSFFDGILTDGIYKGIGDEFYVTPGSGLSVNVGNGRAWLYKTWLYNDGAYNIVLSPADPLRKRIDSVIISIDKPSRTNSLTVLTGEPASNPVPPELVNNEDHREYRIADVLIDATATSLTALDITNYIGEGDLPYAGVTDALLLFSETTPKMDGTATIGVERSFARGDHIHPTDTTKANVASPTFTGIPKAPTATSATNTTQIATTQFVQGHVSALNNAIALKAPLASPTLTGTPKAPTASAGTNTTQIATTQFVQTAIAPKAPLASPTFTGAPKAPTAGVGTNTTQLATTEFVHKNPRNKVYTATCSTASATAAKVATIDGSAVDFSLTAGVRVKVTFRYGHDCFGNNLIKATLNVNGTGAKTIVVPQIGNGMLHDLDNYNTTGNTIWWCDYETITFTYTGTYWLMQPSSLLLMDAWMWGTDYYEYGLKWSDTKVSPNTVVAGPTSGTALGVIDARSLVIADLPSIPLTNAKLTGTLPVSKGGTGRTSLNAGTLLVGNGTDPVNFRAIDASADTSISINGVAVATLNSLRFSLNRTTSVAAASTYYTTVMARGIALYPSASAAAALNVNGTIGFVYE